MVLLPKGGVQPQSIAMKQPPLRVDISIHWRVLESIDGCFQKYGCLPSNHPF